MKTKTKNNDPTTDLLSAFLRAVRLRYAGDPSGAGVVMAELPSGEFYASVCRYRSAFGKDKEVVSNTKGATALGTLEELARAWLNRPEDAEAAAKRLGELLPRGRR